MPFAKKLTLSAFSRAKRFLETEARELEGRLFAFHSGGDEGSTGRVIEELAGYQNPDGGFGKALEPDVRMQDSGEAPVIAVGGVAARDIGIQCGGWTIEWQGKPEPITLGTTLLDGIEAAAPLGVTVYYNRFGQPDRVPTPDGSPVGPDVCIAAVGERPYAEGVGDCAELALPDEDVTVLENMAAGCEQMAVVLVSGRPLIITDWIEGWDAVVAAWLPGTEGQGVADVLFGHQPFTGRLPYTWPRSVDRLPTGSLEARGEAPLFPLGYGLEQ